MTKILIFIVSMPVILSVILSVIFSATVSSINVEEDSSSIVLAATVYNTQLQGEINGFKYYEIVGTGSSCNNFSQCYYLICSMKSDSPDGSLITYITGYTGYPYNGNTPINKIDTYILSETTYNGYDSFSYNAAINVTLMYFTKLEKWGLYVAAEAVTGNQYILHYPYQC